MISLVLLSHFSIGQGEAEKQVTKKVFKKLADAIICYEEGKKNGADVAIFAKDLGNHSELFYISLFID